MRDGAKRLPIKAINDSGFRGLGKSNITGQRIARMGTRSFRLEAVNEYACSRLKDATKLWEVAQL
jgi:hypothetical protein